MPGEDQRMHVNYCDSNGVIRTVEAKPGQSVMEVAKQANIPEIDAECGGVCSCASCHVYVDERWLNRFPPTSKIENSLLSLLEMRKPNSRLSCQLRISEDMDGITVHTPAPIL
jgi:ferredoxin, 2Fe-2S